ncbi:VOC family protein [Spirosoma radiotolerans]|uniref:hypothetical protein n=1 Tax=Spirosoma radiotolerans TaxID=1379870 RepID=UPI0011DDB5C2|nr:hypothetical protein [Spirosoma radiotolerans]
MIPSFDLKETAHFFEDVLAFRRARHDETYSILHKNNLTVHVQRAGAEIGEQSFYLEVDDIDLLWEFIKYNVASLRVKEPFDQAYGMREAHIIIPSTKTLLFIGQLIKNKLHT